MRFRTTLALSLSILITGTLAATVGGVAATLEGAAYQDLGEELRRSREVFEQLGEQRAALRRSESRVVAEEPRLKAVVATEDVSHETVFGVAHELRRALQSDLFLLTDGEGVLLTDVLDATAAGFDLKGKPLIAGALADGESTGVWIDGGRVFDVNGRRLSFGTTAVGVLVIGYALDDGVAERARRQIGSAVVIELDGRALAASSLDGGAPADRDALAAALAAVPTGEPGAAPAEVDVGGARYLAVAAPLPGYRGELALRYVVLRSLDRALAPAARVARVLYAIAAAALSAGVLLAAALSRRLSRPLDALAAVTGRIAAGDLDARAPAAGPLEVRALGDAMNRMTAELAESRRQMVEKERLEKELEIGARIQTCLLPRTFAVDGLDVAARMIPASEVGGDYYDVLPVPGSAWIGIGDVAGHGLTSGLVMMMVQSVVSALARQSPQAPPRDVLRALNRALYDNIRNRMGTDEHVTLTLLRYRRDGLLVFAGAHEEIIVLRATTGRCEIIETPGPWVGGMEDVNDVTVENRLQLENGDVMVLYTDGITEARDASGQMFGIEPIVAALEASPDAAVEHLRDEILNAVEHFAPHRDDDATLLVMRYHAPEKRVA